MTAETCAVCESRPTPDGYACAGCADRAAGHLAAIIGLASDARAVAAGLVRRGRGGSGGKPGSRPPLNDGATDVMHAVTNALTTLARDIAETRGPQSVSKRSRWRTQPDPLVSAAKALTGQLEWLRHATDDQGGPYAVAAFAEIAHCAGRLRSLVNGPSESRYLGPCGAELLTDVTDVDPEHGEGIRTYRADTCDGDIYGTRGASRGRCRTCGAEVAQDDRQAWLDGEVRAHAFTAAQIAEAYGINVKTIRSWATDRAESRDHRGTLTRSATPARLRTHAVGRDGQALFLVGDVLDLAAADAARRETERAKRERRAAARAADDERMSA